MKDASLNGLKIDLMGAGHCCFSLLSYSSLRWRIKLVVEMAIQLLLHWRVLTLIGVAVFHLNAELTSSHSRSDRLCEHFTGSLSFPKV